MPLTCFMLRLRIHQAWPVPDDSVDLPQVSTPPPWCNLGVHRSPRDRVPSGRLRPVLQILPYGGALRLEISSEDQPVDSRHWLVRALASNGHPVFYLALHVLQDFIQEELSQWM